MTERDSERSGRLRRWLGRLPVAAVLVAGVLIVVGTGTGGYYALQAYHYVEHDNSFCFSCHLMQDPYELFAQSAHRGLGCKACHRPSLLERSQMGAASVVTDPDSVSAHAPVPNEVCADCHIDGDPEKWTLIASSAGHRVHFESDARSLAGLKCVECHSSSLHQFTAADQTCAQSGCHVDSDVQLGTMGALTIHCVACHEYSTPVENESEAVATLAPDESTCLACHAMRVLAQMPEDDPHDGSCASCHDPHEQATAAEAAGSCAACHDDVEESTPFHGGLGAGVLDDCMSCHQAHDFAIDGTDCLLCHGDVMDAEPTVPRASALERGSGLMSALDTGARNGSALVPGTALLHSWGYRLQSTDFRHSEHPDLDCSDCHSSATSHGELTVTSVADCRSCHHDEGQAAEGCEACHSRAEGFSDPRTVTRVIRLTVGGPVSRSMAFDHAPHTDVECATCHTEGLALSAAQIDCASCHQEHHEPVTDCSACHIAKAGGSHVVETAHETCSSSGCHEAGPFDGTPPRDRTVCLVCHQDMVDHEPDRECALCHALPEGRTDS
jgi:hypothetical protein